MVKISSETSKKVFQRNLFLFIILFLLGLIGFYYSRNLVLCIGGVVLSEIVLNVYFYFNKKLVISADVRKMENVFPDFIELVSSNLKAGMTIDQALLRSSRKEFAPLDAQILRLGKDIMTGKEIARSLADMAKRTGSEKIQKTIDLIISGLKSGGNIAVLLEETAVNIRERAFVEKRAASNVLMYIILISFAIMIGAPALFALSSVLVSVMSSILSDVPISGTSMNLPFSLSEISISTSFITVYSVIFLAVIGILSALLLGLVSKGDEKEGLKYAPFFVGIAWIVFFIMKTVLNNSFSSIFG